MSQSQMLGKGGSKDVLYSMWALLGLTVLQNDEVLLIILKFDVVILTLTQKF